MQHPRNAEAATYAATALLHQPADKRDNAKARALLEQAIAADPKLADAYYQLGVLEQEGAHWQESVAPLEKGDRTEADVGRGALPAGARVLASGPA